MIDTKFISIAEGRALAEAVTGVVRRNSICSVINSKGGCDGAAKDSKGDEGLHDYSIDSVRTYRWVN